VQNVSLSELTTTPFKATINFQKVYYSPGTRHERAGRRSSRSWTSRCATVCRTRSSA
jgi:hypothetical protein